MRLLAIIAALAVLGGAAYFMRAPTATPPCDADAELESVASASLEQPATEFTPSVRDTHPLAPIGDSFAALAAVETVDDPDEMTAAREQWANSISVSEIRAVLDSMSPAELTGDAAQLLVRRWVGFEPQIASIWAESLADAEARPILQTALALAWSETDIESTLVWADRLTDTRAEVLTQLGYELARDNPLRALNIATPLPATTGRDELILHALRQWGAADSTAARAWLQEWPASELRVRALTELAVATAENDPISAANIAATQTETGPQQDRAVIGVVQRWAQTDQAAALTWVESFPAINLREDALFAIASVSNPPP